MKTAAVHHAFTQNDVGAPASHVGGQGHHALLSGMGYDLGFFFVLLGVEHFVLDAFPLQELAQVLGLFDGGGTHQDRLAPLVAIANILHRRMVFFCLGAINHIGMVDPNHRFMGGDDHDLKVVDLFELLGFGVGGAGHARQFLVHAEVILEGDGGQGLVFVLDLHPFLGLQGLVQAIGVAAAGHEAAGELVHDDDLTVFDDVIHVQFKQVMGLQCGLEVVQDFYVTGIVEVGQVNQFFGMGHALFGDEDGPGLFVYGEVFFFLELPGHLIEVVIELSRFLGGAGDNQWRPGLVDKDGIDFVDDGVVKIPLDVVLEGEFHVVPEIVEAELIVGAVGDVGGVSPAALVVIEAMDDGVHREAQEAVDVAHPLGVPAGQVVVDGDDMDAFAGQGVEVGGHGGHQGLAFTGLHLGDFALVEHDAADELDIEGAHP